MYSDEFKKFRKENGLMEYMRNVCCSEECANIISSDSSVKVQPIYYDSITKSSTCALCGGNIWEDYFIYISVENPEKFTKDCKAYFEDVEYEQNVRANPAHYLNPVTIDIDDSLNPKIAEKKDEVKKEEEEEEVKRNEEAKEKNGQKTPTTPNNVKIHSKLSGTKRRNPYRLDLGESNKRRIDLTIKTDDDYDDNKPRVQIFEDTETSMRDICFSFSQMRKLLDNKDAILKEMNSYTNEEKDA